MKIEHDDLAYLSGERFSNGRAFAFIIEEDDRHYLSRSEVLTSLVNGKKIIHLGCVDHDVSSINKKISKGKWLHKTLDEVAKRCLGVDINHEGVRYINDELGFADVIVSDVTQSPTGDLATENWDYFLIPEVLEHVNNPVDFLERIRHNYQGNVDRMVITVPNALTPENCRYAKKGLEVINTDHRYWFTPYTLAKVVINAGLTIENITMCRHGRVKKRSLLKNRWYKKHPLMRSDIVMTVGF